MYIFWACYLLSLISGFIAEGMLQADRFMHKYYGTVLIVHRFKSWATSFSWILLITLKPVAKSAGIRHLAAFEFFIAAVVSLKTVPSKLSFSLI